MQPVDGPAFPMAVRLLATAMVAGMAGWGLAIRAELGAAGWNLTAAVVVGGSAVLVAWCLVWMWRSRTRVDAQGIHQTWIWDKHVRWDQIAQARMVGVPYLQWLITPRLVVRPRGGGVLTFHSADPRVLGVFATYVTFGAPLVAPPAGPAGDASPGSPAG